MGIRGVIPPSSPRGIDDGEYWKKTGGLYRNSPSDIMSRILIINFKLRFIFQKTGTRTKEWKHKETQETRAWKQQQKSSGIV